MGAEGETALGVLVYGVRKLNNICSQTVSAHVNQTAEKQRAKSNFKQKTFSVFILNYLEHGKVLPGVTVNMPSWDAN